jgi:hypothetical protein
VLGNKRVVVLDWPSERLNDAVPKFLVNANTVVSPSGIVSFLTTIVPRLVFVKVQVTVSPGDRSIADVGDPSEHVADFASQPEGIASVTEYVPPGDK